MHAVKPMHYTIHMAGDIQDARRIIRKFVLEGACVQLNPCSYIYTGGLEEGFTARIMHYARFPSSRKRLRSQAARLAKWLASELAQASYSIESDLSCTYHEVIKK